VRTVVTQTGSRQETAPATSLSESLRRRSGYFLTRFLRLFLRLNGLDNGVNSRPTYSKSNHCSISLARSDISAVGPPSYYKFELSKIVCIPQCGNGSRSKNPAENSGPPIRRRDADLAGTFVTFVLTKHGLRSHAARGFYHAVLKSWQLGGCGMGAPGRTDKRNP